MFKKLSLNAKLIMMFAVCATLLAAVGGLSVYALKKTSELYTHVADVNLPNSQLINSFRADGNDAFRLLLQLNIDGNDEKETARLVKKLNSFHESFEKSKKAYEAVPFVPGEAELYEDLKKHWASAWAYVEKTVNLAQSPSPADRAAFGDLYRAGFNDARQSFYKATDALQKFHDTEAKKWTKDAHTVRDLQTNLVILIVALGFLSSLAMGIIFSRSLSKQLSNVSTSLVEGATQVNSAATEIATSSESLSSSSSEQAAAVQETSSAVEELTAMVSRNADNADKSKDKAGTSHQVAQKGKAAVGEMLTAISDINVSNASIMKAVEESNKNISEISRVIMDIGAKTTVIKDIVFQTKLLSFNASVEAARAGEHGKGFSVVAEEVGNLAQMSGNAAQEISSTLEESIKKVNQIVTDTKQTVEALILEGKEKVERGHEIASQCGEILEQIVAEVSDVSSMSVEISSASKEQSVGIQEITKAMSQMDTVTQQNASISQTAASASVELAAQSESLSVIVSDLQALIYGVGNAKTQQNAEKKSAKKKAESKVIAFSKPAKKAVAGIPSYEDLKVSGDE